MTGSIGSAKPRGARKHRALALLVAILFNLLLLTGLALYLLDDDDYRHLLIWSADYFLDSQLAIDGSFSIRFARVLELDAEQVRLRANDGSYDLSLGKFYLQQRFGSYLSTGTFWINKLDADDLRVEITASQSDEEFDWQQLSVLPVVIEETRLKNLSLTYRSGDRPPQTIELSYLVLDDENNQGPLKVSAAGVMNSHALVFAGTLGSLEQLRNSKQNFPIDFSLRSAGPAAGSADRHDKPVIELKGTVDRARPGDSAVDATFAVDLAGLVPLFSQEIIAHRLGRLQGSVKVANVHHDWDIQQVAFTATDTDLYRLKIDGALDKSLRMALLSEFEVPDPAAFGAQFGIDLGGYAAYRGKGRLAGNPSRFSYQGQFGVGRMESDIDVTVALPGSRPSLQGKWNVRDLYLADIGIKQRLEDLVDPASRANPAGDVKGQPATSKPPASAATAEVAGSGRAAIDFSGLHKVNLDLDVAIDKLVGADYAFNRLSGKIRLSDGLLNIAPLRVITEGGAADLELTLAAGKTPAASLKVKTENLVLGELLGQLPAELRAEGKLNLEADVKSAGHSVDELLSALVGDVNLSLAQVTLPGRYLDYFSADRPATTAAGGAYSSIEMDGAVAASFGKVLHLSASALHLKTSDGSYEVTMGKLDLQQNLAAYLESGELLIHDLLLEDMQLAIAPVQEAPQKDRGKPDPAENDWHEVDWQGYDLPALVVEKMRLGRLSVDYREGEQRHTATLASFVIDNDVSSEPMTLSASGTIDARTLQLAGSVGTAAQPRGEKRTYPIDFTLSSGGSGGAAPDQPVVKFNGSVDRTAASGSHVDTRFDIALNRLMAIIDPETTADRLGNLQGDLNIVEANGRWGIRKIQFAATGTDLYRLSVDGALDDAFKLELNAETEIPDTAAFGAQFGIDLSAYRPYKGKGQFSGTRSKLNYRGTTHIGRIENTTTLAVTRVNGKPFIQGKFAIPNLYLEDIGLNLRLGVDPRAPAAVAAPKPEKSVYVSRVLQPLFSREPLDFSGLQRFNLDLEVLIDEITGTDFSIDQLSGEIGLTDGVLRVSPMRLVFEGGDTDLALVIDSRAQPSMTLKVTADNLVLGELISQVQTEVSVEGKAHIDIDVKSSGHSAHELASDLSGDVGFGLENARLPKKYLDFLSADLFGWMFRMVTFEDSYTSVDCLIMDFDVDQGVAKSNFLVADGPSVIIQGKATLDLGQETIDMLLLPRQKQGIHTGVASAEIKGPLRDPSVHTSAGKAALVGLGGLALLPDVFIPLGIIDVLWKKLFVSDKEGKGCTELIAKSKAVKQKIE